MNGDKIPPEDLESTKRVEPPDTGPPQRIGPYRILQKLGEGGMGEVYHAEQEEPIRRRVALKLIKLGMDTKQVVARFESERQALAIMNHPNVAKVFDAGATEQGRPYFAMEYVKGEPVTKYCDRHRLTTKDRLDLFMQICDGVQHAHQKGIIHRDIKPSNVLVALQDDKPVPKIIDFGVAKATELRLTEKTVFTQMGVLIGTPEYMSPEQAEMTGLDIDTRTDVYSLGVLLYELLVGALPLGGKEFRKAGFDEIRRKVREDEPSRPSARLSTLGEESTESAQKRRTDLPTLRRQLRGDLDWITMRALEKDRTRRYGSPTELAADIGRHLRSEPVLAGSPSAVYRLSKFARRHRVGVGIAAGLLVLLVGFAATMAVQAGRIASERDRANQEAERANEEAAVARQVSEFLVGLFRVSNPSRARGNTITAREILDRGAADAERELSDQPLVQARMMGTMGGVYLNLGLYERAESLLGKSEAKRRTLLGPDHPDTLKSIGELGWTYTGQGRYVDAERAFLETLQGQRQVLDQDHPDALRTMAGLAFTFTFLGRREEAEVLYQEALAGRRRVLGDRHRATLASMSDLGFLYIEQGRFDEAEPLYREALEIQRRALGDDHPDTLHSVNNLGYLLNSWSRYDEAASLHREALEARRHILGDDNPSTLWSMYNLAWAYSGQGRHEDAERLSRETLERRRRVLGTDHRDTLWSMDQLAGLHRRLGRYAEAMPLVLEALEGRRRLFGDDHPETLRSIQDQAAMYTGQGLYEEAESLLLEDLEIRRRLRLTDRRGKARTLYILAWMEARRGDAREAMEWLRQSVEAGWIDAEWLSHDPDFGSLHGTAEFDAIVEEVKRRNRIRETPDEPSH